MYHELKVVKKLIQTGGAYFLDYFTTNVTMSTQYIDMLKAWWRHLEFPNWIFHISNISIIVTTWRSFSSKLYSLYFLSTKNAFQCCPHWKQRVQLSTLHTKVRSYILPNYFWDMVWLRFGRKDHMTRHAKKTHANFYDSSERLERTRLISTPLPGESILFSFGLICSHSVSWSNFTGEEEEELASRVAPSRKERWVLNCSYKECHNEQGGKP